MWHDHGIMPFAGGYYDQPPEWRHDIELFDATFNYWAWRVRQEVKDRNNA